MEGSPSALDYRTPAVSAGSRRVWRFQLIYALGIVAAYVTVWSCWGAWPHTSNSADPRKAELAMTIQVAGGAACAWLVLALRRTLRNDAIRRSVWTWLLIAANAFVALAVMPAGYN